MVIDELIVRKGTTRYPIDSYENQMIDEIVYEGQSFHFAKQKDLTGTNEIVADNGVAEPIISLGVNGNTSQDGTPTPETPIPIQNANDNGMSVVLHGKNIINFDNLTLQQNLQANGTTTANQNYNTFDYMEVKPNQNYRWKFLNNYQSSVGTQRRIVAFDSDKNAISLLYQNTLYDEGQEEAIFKTPSNAKYIRASYGITDTKLSIVPLFDTLDIPTSVTYTNTEGTSKTVPLLFSKWDKLTVDRIKGEVKYIQGSWSGTLTGNEDWKHNNYANTTFGMKCYQYSKTYPTQCVSPTSEDLSVLNCNCFKTAVWGQVMIETGDYTCTLTENYTLIFRFTGTEDVSVFKEFLQSKYAEGNPVTLLAKRKTPVEHDITSTDLGQKLLALATRKGTNILEISSDLAPSQTDLSYWRQIIPNE